MVLRALMPDAGVAELERVLKSARQCHLFFLVWCSAEVWQVPGRKKQPSSAAWSAGPSASSIRLKPVSRFGRRSSVCV